MRLIRILFITLAFSICAFSCQDPADNSISGKWIVKSINGKEIPATMNIPSLTLNTEDNTYHGVTGVNYLNGDFELKAGTISFSDAPMTRMMGDPVSMEVESDYLHAISNAFSLKMKNNTLMIGDKDGNNLFILVRE
ncbi:MAG: META domain-containing protein [Candidatus Limimorpha sp.]